MKKNIKSDETALGFQIAPMIDVVFVIMLFFMVMSTTIKSEREFTSKLPSKGQPHLDNESYETIIAISEDGYVSVNEEELGVPSDTKLAGLTSLLGNLNQYNTSAGARTLVTIQSENEVRYQRIIEVLNAVSKAHIENVTFAVGEEG